MRRRLTYWPPVAFLLGAVLLLLPATSGAGQNFALDFTNNRVDIPYIGIGVDFSEISLEAWVYWRGHAGTEGVSGIMEGRGSTLHWQLNANNNVRIRLEGIDRNASAGVRQNEWFHLAVTYSRATRQLRMYKNGTVFYTYSGDSGTTTFWTSSSAQIGTSLRSGDRRWNGLIDEVRIWNKARTEPQIQENMDQELVGTEEGLIAYWKFNEGQGTTAFDSGPKKYNGTIVGATWSTNAAPLRAAGVAFGPAPASGAADVLRDTALSWKAGKDIQKQNVYLGTDPNAVGAADVTKPLGVLVRQDQTATTYVPAGVLEYGKTYYWRVDGIAAGPDATVFKGKVWSFTVEPYAYPLTKITATASSSQTDMGPEKTIDGSGLNAANQHSTEPKQMWLSAAVLPNWIQYEFDTAYKLHELWVWNSNQVIEPIVGFGAKNVKIETSVDGAIWTELAGVPEFARATGLATYGPGTTVNLGGIRAKYVKLIIGSTWSGVPQAGLSEVRFFYVPTEARAPQPASAATAVSVDASLMWRPGREAASHRVYFGADANAVANGTVAAKTVTDHSFNPGSMDLATTYYWKVDEVNAATYPGEVWSFTTETYKVLDDFESYTDQAGNEVFAFWIDGYVDKSSGSTVGLTTSQNGTYCETTIVHGGRKSMPLAYDNTAKPNYSEAVRTFDKPQDWTANGIKSLSLWFQGVAGNTGQLYVKINSTKVPYNGNAADLAKTAWIPWNIDLSKVTGNLSKVTSLTIGIEGAGARGILYLDDVRLYPKTPEYYTPVDPGKTDLQAQYSFEGNVNDTSGNGLNGTLKQGALVASDRPNGGSALKIDKTGYVDLGNPPSLDFGTGPWTVTAWYKTTMKGGTDDASQGTIYAKGGDNTGGKRIALIMNQNTVGVLTLVVDDDVTRYDANSSTKTNDDQWHFVAAQREGTALRIYIDGMLEGTTTIPAAYNLAGTSQRNAYIGVSTNQTNGTLYKLFSGLIDDVRLYNRALSVEEILSLAGQTEPVAKPL